MVHYQRKMCGIPTWLLQEYLQELGGSLLEDGSVQGNGWQVSLTQLEDFQVGSLCVGQVQLDLEASEPVFEQLQPRLEKKLLRAGG